MTRTTDSPATARQAGRQPSTNIIGKENRAATTAKTKKKKDAIPAQAPNGGNAVTALVDPAPNADAAMLEIDRLKTDIARLRRESADLASRAPTARAAREIAAIAKPRGEAGSKGFKLVEAMKLDDTAENKALYKSIMRSVRTNGIKAGIDFKLDYREVEAIKLANVFKMTRKQHPYVTKERFPQDWATAEILKQYMRNYRRYNVKKGRVAKRCVRKANHIPSAESAIEEELQPRNIDSESDEEED